MKIKNLIKKLEKMDPNAEIRLHVRPCGTEREERLDLRVYRDILLYERCRG